MNAIIIAIIACEVGFWVVLALGLTARYLLRFEKLSRVLLLCVPLIDLALLCFIAWDMLVNHTTADFTHGLGAVYLGFTVAFGHQIIGHTDAWFAHRFAGGPAPVAPPKTGRAYIRREWEQWFKMLLCAVVASVVLGAIILLVGDPARTAALSEWFGRIWLVTGIWFVGWPLWASLSPKYQREPEQEPKR